MERLSRFESEHERAFLDAFARAVLTWQDAEEALYILFAGLIQGHNHLVVSAAFHAIQGASSKLAVIDSACSLVVKDTKLEPIWKSLHKKIVKRISDRNNLAHLSVSVNLGERPQLGRSLFDFRLSRRSCREYTVQDLCECERKFREITDEIMVFLESIDGV